MKITILKEELFVNNLSQGVEYSIQTFYSTGDLRVNILRLKESDLILLQEKIKEVLEKNQ